MIAPLFDRCVLCGRRTRKPGERLCLRHDIEYLLALGAATMRERLAKSNVKQAKHNQRLRGSIL
jgi:hypothetical protein